MAFLAQKLKIFLKESFSLNVFCFLENWEIFFNAAACIFSEEGIMNK